MLTPTCIDDCAVNRDFANQIRQTTGQNPNIVWAYGPACHGPAAATATLRSYYRELVRLDSLPDTVDAFKRLNLSRSPCCCCHWLMHAHAVQVPYLDGFGRRTNVTLHQVADQFLNDVSYSQNPGVFAADTCGGVDCNLAGCGSAELEALALMQP